MDAPQQATTTDTADVQRPTPERLIEILRDNDAAGDILCGHAADEIARLHALVATLRREVRTQRLEIAGLREERRVLLEADRPFTDSLCSEPAAIGENPTDDPPAAVESVGDSAACDRKSVETEIPTEWFQRPFYVDPPSGWQYGFPRLYDPQADGDMTEWMIRHGYPERLARQEPVCTFTACTENVEK